MSAQYTREENDILADGEKVAMIDKNGTLRMAKGQTEHKEAVEAFLTESGDKAEESEKEEEKVLPSDPFIEHAKRSKPFTEPVGIPDCPSEDPNAGDKTPEVIAWHRKYHPEAFEPGGKYHGRKGSNLTGNA